MTTIGRRGSRTRPGYVSRAFITRLLDAGIIAQAWPRKKPRKRDRYALSIERNLHLITQHVAHMNDREVDPLRQAIAEHNRTHEGFRGSAAIRLEDLLTQHAFGRLFAYRLPDGHTLYHRNAVHDVSRRLDWIEPLVGSILTRAPSGWQPTTPCTPGAQCKLMTSAPIPGCCTPAQPNPNEV